MTMYKGTRVSQLAEARVNLRKALNAQDRFELEDQVHCLTEDEVEEEVWMARAKLQKLLNADSVDEAKERIVEAYRETVRDAGGVVDGGYLEDFKTTIDQLITAVRQDA